MNPEVSRTANNSYFHYRSTFAIKVLLLILDPKVLKVQNSKTHFSVMNVKEKQQILLEPANV